VVNRSLIDLFNECDKPVLVEQGDGWWRGGVRGPGNKRVMLRNEIPGREIFVRAVVIELSVTTYLLNSHLWIELIFPGYKLKVPVKGKVFAFLRLGLKFLMVERPITLTEGRWRYFIPTLHLAAITLIGHNFLMNGSIL